MACHCVFVIPPNFRAQLFQVCLSPEWIPGQTDQQLDTCQEKMTALASYPCVLPVDGRKLCASQEKEKVGQ